MSIFWFHNPKVLFQEIPDILTFIDKLNLIFLASVVISIILVLINKLDLSYLSFAIIIAIITVVIYQHKYVYNIEKFSKNGCIMPSVDNPFMNPNLLSKKFEEPCNVDNAILNDNFYTNTFRDVNDFYERGLSVRQFYTVSGRTIPNDRETLGQWLYNSNDNRKSCKEGNSLRCLKNIDLERNDLRHRVANSEK
jgi:hypothetical protein|tara:strand:+ start:135 stop:716 length:582 start_codon:yes stop_codon:yes gene_type:complete